MLEVLTSVNYNGRKYKGTTVTGAFPQDQEKHYCSVAHGLQKHRDMLGGHQAVKNLPIRTSYPFKTYPPATSHLQPEWKPQCTGRQVSMKFVAPFCCTRWQFKLFLRAAISFFPQTTGTSCAVLRAQGIKFFIKKDAFPFEEESCLQNSHGSRIC